MEKRGRKKSNNLFCSKCGVGEKVYGSWCFGCRRDYRAGYRKKVIEGGVDYRKKILDRVGGMVRDKEKEVWMLAKMGGDIYEGLGALSRLGSYYLDVMVK